MQHNIELEFFQNKLAQLYIKLLDDYSKGKEASQTISRIKNIENEINILTSGNQ